MILKLPITRELVSLILPPGDDFSEVAWRRRELLVNCVQDDEKMGQPTALRNRPPWVTYLHCIVSMERFLQLCISAELDPFTDFGIDRHVLAMWGAGHKLPDFSVRQKIDHRLQDKMGNPKLSIFVVPSDRELEGLGHLTRSHLPAEERTTYIDWDRPGGDRRLALCQRSLSWPLFRYMHVKRKHLIGNDFVYDLQPKVGEMKKFLNQSYKFIERRWELYQALQKKGRTVEVVRKILEKIGDRNVKSEEHPGG